MEKRDQRQPRARARRRSATGGKRTQAALLDAAMVVTTDCVPGWSAGESLGLVTAEVARSLGPVKDFIVGLRDEWGGRSKTLEEHIASARSACLEEIRRAAGARDANAVVGLRLSVETTASSLLLVSAVGTAVRLAFEEGNEPAAAEGSLARCPECGATVESAESASMVTCASCGARVPFLLE